MCKVLAVQEKIAIFAVSNRRTATNSLPRLNFVSHCLIA